MPKKKEKKDVMKRMENKNKCGNPNGCGGFLYFLGFLGSAIFYIQESSGFWAGVLGFLKAIVWPIFLVYKLLGM